MIYGESVDFDELIKMMRALMGICNENQPKMNTTAKGNLLEDQVYEILCRIKESGIYGKHTQIFKHKKYFYNPT